MDRHDSAPKRLPPQRWGNAVAAAAYAVVIAGAAFVLLRHPGAWTTLAVLALAPALLAARGARPATLATRTLALAVGVSALDYLSWRFTVINWPFWWIALPLYLAELLGILHVLGIQYTIWPRRPPPLRPVLEPSALPVFVFIPTVDEGAAILEPTVRGALAARDRYRERHPQARVEIVLCNDGRVAGSDGWAEVEALAARLGVRCITREAGGGAKAGNIENARQAVGATGDALVAIFDADQIAAPEFLLKTVPPMADPAVGWVQTGQYYRNLDNAVARWANDQQSLFYRVLCPGKAALNAAFICGTNVVLRARALDEIGGLPQDSVTEDFIASLELHPRWRGVFLTDVLAEGLGPMDLPAYFRQQRRWATGTLGALGSHGRALLLPRPGSLRPEQRLQYLLACTHYLCGLRDLVYIVAPLCYLLAGVSSVRSADLGSFLQHFLPYWALSLACFWRVARGRTTLRGVLIGFGSFPTLVVVLLELLAGRRSGFLVTAKRRDATGSLRHLLPHALAAAACLAGLGAAALTPDPKGLTLISAAWVLYTLMLLGGTLWLGVADAGVVRVSVPSPLSRLRRGFAGQGAVARRLRVARRALAGSCILAVLMATTSFTIPSGRATAFAPRAEASHPRLGVALPAERLADAVILEREIGAPFAIVGRTQTVGDGFDTAWASDLARRGTRPWITLLLCDPHAPAYEASLPAIANGNHDDALRRWARAVRRYEGPVYLTVLPHVDRDWAVSSAVANGGIPQDVPRAWRHVRRVFDEEGARNVAWVWAPADPAHDREYAPPAAAVDVVLLSLIRLPSRPWPEAAAALDAVARRWPGTPLFVELGAIGEPARKAQWLRRSGAAVLRTRSAHALLYHDGAPDPNAAAAEHARWSMAADPACLQAVRDIRARLDRTIASAADGRARP